DIVDGTGRVLGRHAGLGAYTVGQRRGLGLAGGAPLYVVELGARANRVRVGTEEEQYRGALLAGGWNWVSIPEPPVPIEATARIRSSHAGAEAPIEPLTGGRARLTFRSPQRAISPGQAVVLYDAERVLGGGFILEAL